MIVPMSFGCCELCDQTMTAETLSAHLRTCVLEHASAKGVKVPLFHLHVEDTQTDLYWLDVEIKGTTKLRYLDQYLRQVWLECCGHLSAFRIDDIQYNSPGFVRSFYEYHGASTMNVPVSEVLTSPAQQFSYTYDFGSTTALDLRVIGVRKGSIGRSPLRLLARNEGPPWLCAICKEPATHVCPYCVYAQESFCCTEHIADHACGEPEAFLPVLNSPRMGVCGYTGEY